MPGAHGHKSQTDTSITLCRLQAGYQYADDLSHVWCQWAEMEVKHKNFRRAIDLLARATRPPPSAHQRLSPEQLKARTLAPCYGLEEYTRQDSDMLLL